MYHNARKNSFTARPPRSGGLEAQRTQRRHGGSAFCLRAASCSLNDAEGWVPGGDRCRLVDRRAYQHFPADVRIQSRGCSKSADRFVCHGVGCLQNRYRILSHDGSGTGRSEDAPSGRFGLARVVPSSRYSARSLGAPLCVSISRQSRRSARHHFIRCRWRSGRNRHQRRFLWLVPLTVHAALLAISW